MSAGIRLVLALTWLAAASTGSGLMAQQPALPAAPVPVPPPAGQALQPPILGQPLPAPGAAPAPVYTAPLPPAAPAPFLAPAAPPPPADPGRDGWADLGLISKPEGLFIGTELDFLWPSVRNKLSATVVFPNGSTDTLHVPQSNLDVTVEPTFLVGYHLADSLGDLLLDYCFLTTEGRSNQVVSFGAASTRSRLDINQFDFDYATATYAPLPRYELKFRLGMRLATVFFDSEASNALNYQQASNYFVGAGPVAAIDFERRFKELPELGLFLRADGAVLIGQVRQKYRETLGIGLPDEESAFYDPQKSQTSEVLTVQAGFVYHPLGFDNDRLRITGGYEFQYWWGVGKLNGSTAPLNVSSDAEISAQGVFLRAEYDF
jgi:Legionella pneumophila major outer membrane protein precursor